MNYSGYVFFFCVVLEPALQGLGAPPGIGARRLIVSPFNHLIIAKIICFMFFIILLDPGKVDRIACVRQTLSDEVAPRSHRARVLTAENVQGALGQHFQRGTGAIIMAFQRGCVTSLFRTFCFYKICQNADTPETIRSVGRTLIWKVAPGGAKNHHSEPFWLFFLMQNYVVFHG